MVLRPLPGCCCVGEAGGSDSLALRQRCRQHRRPHACPAPPCPPALPPRAPRAQERSRGEGGAGGAASHPHVWQLLELDVPGADAVAALDGFTRARLLGGCPGGGAGCLWGLVSADGGHCWLVGRGARSPTPSSTHPAPAHPTSAPQWTASAARRAAPRPRSTSPRRSSLPSSQQRCWAGATRRRSRCGGPLGEAAGGSAHGAGWCGGQPCPAALQRLAPHCPHPRPLLRPPAGQGLAPPAALHAQPCPHGAVPEGTRPYRRVVRPAGSRRCRCCRQSRRGAAVARRGLLRRGHRSPPPSPPPPCPACVPAPPA